MGKNSKEKRISHVELALLDRTSGITNAILEDVRNLFKYNTEIEKYKDSLLQVKVLLDKLIDEDREKIPSDVIEMIDNNANNEYEFNYNSRQPIEKQGLLPEAIYVLAFINMEYLLEEDSKDILNRMHMYNDTKISTEEDVKVNQDKVFDEEIKVLVDEDTLLDEIDLLGEEVSLVEIKKGFFARIIEKIKSLCHGISLFN